MSPLTKVGANGMILAKPSLFPPIKEIVFFGKRALNNPAPGVSREGRTGAFSPKHLYFYTLKEIVLFRKRALNSPNLDRTWTWHRSKLSSELAHLHLYLHDQACRHLHSSLVRIRTYLSARLRTRSARAHRPLQTCWRWAAAPAPP